MGYICPPEDSAAHGGGLHCVWKAACTLAANERNENSSSREIWMGPLQGCRREN